ncbi:MAG: S-methyl-5-thioribose-1-phosphate isomerase, partial [Anaerolineae bacterium]|nr:S-methyl-5-thioribose-1-phosphate isomerase [Anaerolineae bacterium]
MGEYFSIRWVDGMVRMLDQRLLPDEVVYHDYIHCSDIATAIRDMVIRGAPAIGVAAAFGLALTALSSSAKTTSDLIKQLDTSSVELKGSRPTAVNLSWAIDRINKVFELNA